MYSDGQGVPKDPAQALTWFRKSADQEYPPAEFNMGVLYAAGTGVPRDLEQAVEWYRKAAARGAAPGSGRAEDHSRHGVAVGPTCARDDLRERLGEREDRSRGGVLVSEGRRAGLSARGVRSGADAGRRPGCAEE